MTRHPIVLPLILALLLLMSVPAAATVVQTTVSLTPNPPLTPGGPQKVAATYVIIPSGAMTFSGNHELQMQTDLADAQWVIQVIVDGHNAARQTASGNAAFFNGALLSYPTNHDVSFTVTINGTVPPAAGPQVLVLQVEELDNAGHVVPGSVLTITEPVAGHVPTETVTPLPTMTPVRAPATTATPRADLPPACGVLAAGIGLLLVAWRRDR